MTPSNPRTEARAAASGAAAQVHDPAYAGTRTGDDATVAGLLRRLADDTTSLVTKEIALARAEVGRSVDSLKAAMAGMLVGAVVLICGLGVLLRRARTVARPARDALERCTKSKRDPDFLVAHQPRRRDRRDHRACRLVRAPHPFDTRKRGR